MAAVLLFGFKTRLAAAVLAAYSAVTALFFQAQFGDQNQLIHFLKNIAITGGLLHVVAFGGGAISIDAVLDRKSVPASALRAR